MHVDRKTELYTSHVHISDVTFKLNVNVSTSILIHVFTILDDRSNFELFLLLLVLLFLVLLPGADGLVDCMDPDCCLQASCHTTSLCVGSPDPLDIIQETQISSGQSTLQSFYERIRFLIGRDSTHVIPGANPFDGR